jgi:hypothetical protein
VYARAFGGHNAAEPHSRAVIFLGLAQTASAQVIHACVNNSSGDMKIVPAGATCPRNWTSLSWNVTGPPGQGATLLVDAKGNTVGRYFPSFTIPHVNYVMLQIQVIWVDLPVFDFSVGFQATDPTQAAFGYLSTDCTGQPYMSPIAEGGLSGGRQPTRKNRASEGVVMTIPPATSPTIYFAGNVVQVTLQSFKAASGGPCNPWDGNVNPNHLGPVQSYPVSSLGFTLPFSIK